MGCRSHGDCHGSTDDDHGVADIIFFAVLVGIGRLVGDGEVTALKAAGISPYRLFIPVLQLAVACTLLTLLMSAWLGSLGDSPVTQGDL